MIYQFKCRTCNTTFEVDQPIHQEHKADCPLCGGPGQRIYSPLAHYWLGSAHNPDGSVQELPPAPQDHQYGWHGFGEGKKEVDL